MRVRILGCPVEEGAGRPGCGMGPSAMRCTDLIAALGELGHEVTDDGLVTRGPLAERRHGNPSLKRLPEVVAWTAAIAEATYRASADAFPILIGGDHAISGGTLLGLSRRAADLGRPLFVLWLDSHPDFHTLETTESGNLHGVQLAYVCGLPGFEGIYPPVPHPIDPQKICAIGLRSVDPAERVAITTAGMIVHDMRAVDEHGIVSLLRPFLETVAAANGLLHVSLDVDFLDPGIAPAVGTTVPGGATFREAHLIMEMLSDSGLVTSLDLVELNPFLDDRGRTANLLADLTESLMGRRIMDRPTRSY